MILSLKHHAFLAWLATTNNTGDIYKLWTREFVQELVDDDLINISRDGSVYLTAEDGVEMALQTPLIAEMGLLCFIQSNKNCNVQMCEFWGVDNLIMLKLLGLIIVSFQNYITLTALGHKILNKKQ